MERVEDRPTGALLCGDNTEQIKTQQIKTQQLASRNKSYVLRKSLAIGAAPEGGKPPAGDREVCFGILRAAPSWTLFPNKALSPSLPLSLSLSLSLSPSLRLAAAGCGRVFEPAGRMIVS